MGVGSFLAEEIAVLVTLGVGVVLDGGDGVRQEESGLLFLAVWMMVRVGVGAGADAAMAVMAAVRDVDIEFEEGHFICLRDEVGEEERE